MSTCIGLETPSSGMPGFAPPHHQPIENIMASNANRDNGGGIRQLSWWPRACFSFCLWWRCCCCKMIEVIVAVFAPAQAATTSHESFSKVFVLYRQRGTAGACSAHGQNAPSADDFRPPRQTTEDDQMPYQLYAHGAPAGRMQAIAGPAGACGIMNVAGAPVADNKARPPAALDGQAEVPNEADVVCASAAAFPHRRHRFGRRIFEYRASAGRRQPQLAR